MVPSTSGCPSCPIRITSRPSRAKRDTSMCTFVTSGQVASKTRRPRRRASACTAFGTPWALKITVASAGTSSSSSTNTAPSPRNRSTTKRLCTTSWRT